MLSLRLLGLVLAVVVFESRGFSLRSFARRVKSLVGTQINSAVTTPYQSDKELKEGIAQFYDESSGIWLDVWGEDMHHGYYPNPDFRDHKAAQRLMIEKSLEFGYGERFPDFTGKKMVDVGCGVGGSSRYIVRNYGGSADGVSLSPYQVSRANAFSAQAKLSDALHYQVADAMQMPFPSNNFDLTWSMESGEHMPNKQDFVNELVRVTKPGGRILIVTWCHRELNSGETQLASWENKLLNRISKAYYLPAWVPASQYVSLCEAQGLEDIRTEDWSEFVLPFWPAVIRSALVPKNFVAMFRSGFVTVKGAIASLWMRKGLKKQVIKFAIITARKKSE